MVPPLNRPRLLPPAEFKKKKKKNCINHKVTIRLSINIVEALRHYNNGTDAPPLLFVGYYPDERNILWRTRCCEVWITWGVSAIPWGAVAGASSLHLSVGLLASGVVWGWEEQRESGGGWCVVENQCVGGGRHVVDNMRITIHTTTASQQRGSKLKPMIMCQVPPPRSPPPLRRGRRRATTTSPQEHQQWPQL